jgi:RimJ/RimL family protein N-acetyltransferase
MHVHSCGGRPLTSLEGGVDVDNIASIAALKKNVFTFDDVDDEGMFPVRITL